MYQVVKRDGKVVDFNLSKIAIAITKAFDGLDKQYTPDIIDLLALKGARIAHHRVDAAWMNGIDPHTAMAQFERRNPGQAAQPPLA